MLRGSVPAQLADDVARLRRIGGEMHLAADRLQSLRKLARELGQSVEVGAPPPLEVLATLGEVEVGEACVAPPTNPGHRGRQRTL